MKARLCYLLIFFLCQNLYLSQAVGQRLADTASVSAHKSGTQPLKRYGYQLFESSPENRADFLLRPVSPDYPLGPGDEIQLHIWGTITLKEVLQVTPEGYITIPEFDHRIYLNGLEFSQLQSVIIRELSDFYAGVLTPEMRSSGQTFVEITLTKIRGVRILVVGEVERPGSYVFSSTSADLLSALMRAGGIMGSGSLRSIKITSRGEQHTVDLYDLLLKGDPTSKTFFLRDGDVVFVPIKPAEVSIDGQVKRPAIYEVKEGETLQALIQLAGGSTPQADLSRLQVVRFQSSRTREVLDIDFRDSDTPLVLSDGDQVTVFGVPEDWKRSIVTIEGDGIRKPGTYQFVEGMTLQELIHRSGGFFEDVLQERANLIRTNSDQSKTLLQLNLKEEGEDNFSLQPLDQIITYSQHTLEGGDKTVSIRGEVKHPGTYTLAEKMRISDLLFAVVGIEDADFRRRIHLEQADLIRTDKTTPGKLIIPVDLRALLRGNPESDLELHSEDELVIYAASEFEDEQFVTIKGSVRKPGQYRLLNNMTLKDLLVQAGGLMESAYSLYIEVARINRDTNSNGEVVEILKTSPESVDDLWLKNADAIFVRSDPEHQPMDVVVLSGDVRFPGEYALKQKGERFSELIQHAGGLLESAFTEGCVFYRRQSEPQRVIVDLDKALKGEGAYDILLVDRDSIHIPSKNWTIKVQGAVSHPGLVQWKPGAKFNYYIDAVGGFTRAADKDNVRIVRANGFVAPAFKRFWFDLSVPLGSTILAPEK